MVVFVVMAPLIEIHQYNCDLFHGCLNTFDKEASQYTENRFG